MIRPSLLANNRYPYAISENGKTIFIEEINEENRHNTRYFCFGCGSEVFPVLCKKRRQHFRHSKNSQCDPNRYLHEFAKSQIKSKFDIGEHFIVKYRAKTQCKELENCSFYQKYHWKECKNDGIYEIDLKKHYDRCELEKEYYRKTQEGEKRFIADLQLTNSNNEKQRPVNIEIWVTHECTEDKKQNGGKIIEIKIENEKDVFRPIIENSDSEKPIFFHNFERDVKNIKPNRLFKHITLSAQDNRIVIDEMVCGDLLSTETLQNDLIIYYSNNTVSDNELKIFYLASLAKKGIVNYDELCSYVKYNWNHTHNYCRFYDGKKCPCSHYELDPIKAARILNRRWDFIIIKNIE